MNVEERSQPEPMTGCLIWLGSVNVRGYGRVRYKTKVVRAHRELYFDANPDADPKGMVLHKCNTPSCINLDHLRYAPPGTAAPRTRSGQHKGINNCNGRLTDEIVESILLSRESDRAEASRYGISRQYVGDLRRGRARADVFWRLKLRMTELANRPASEDVI